MTRSDLVAKLADRFAQLTQRDTEFAVHTILDTLSRALARRPSLAPEADPPLEWPVHDRMHVEFAIDYPLGKRPSAHTWEAYFFVPASFRLH